MLPPEQVAAVQAATERYRTLKARLQEQADQGLAELVARLTLAERRRA